MKKLKYIALVCGFWAYSQHNYVKINPSDSEEEIIKKAANVIPSERQLKWQELELTAFIHFGINTFTDREWGTGKEDPRIFNPEKLNAEQWVTTLKNAGFKQIILTAKHHDGFCLWPTQTTEHSVKNSPWKNGKGDVVKEIAEACRKHNIGFGVYLSPWDMNASSYGTPAYNQFFEKQLTELLTRYGTIKEVWFDGANGEGPNGKKQEYDFKTWYQIIRKLQPEAVIAVMGPDVRWVGTETGIGRTTEWSVLPANSLDFDEVQENSQAAADAPPKADLTDEDLGSRKKLLHAKGLIWYPAETDVSIRPGWFYHASQDNEVKSPETLFDIYQKSVGRNGVLLLNVPPNKDGLISEADVKALTGFRHKVQTAFSHNLLKGAKLESRKAGKVLTDLKLSTDIEISPEESSIEFTLKKPVTARYFVAQENIAKGQRAENFIVYYEKNGKWEKLTEGTTIGYKRILSFEPVLVSKIKIEFTEMRAPIQLSEAGLY